LDVSAFPGDPAAVDIDHALKNHFHEKQLAFAQVSASPRALEWMFLVTGKKQRAAHLGALLRAASSPPTNALTHAQLRSECAKFPSLPAPENNHSLVFVGMHIVYVCGLSSSNIVSTVPIASLVVGPFLGTGTHYCLARRAWDRHLTPAVTEASSNPMCYDSCLLSLGDPTPAESAESSAIGQETSTSQANYIDVSSARCLCVISFNSFH